MKNFTHRFIWPFIKRFSTERSRSDRSVTELFRNQPSGPQFPFAPARVTDYPDRLMFQDAYVKCDRLETETLLEDFNGHLDGAAFPPATTVIMARPLSFYPGYTFYDIADHATMPARRRFLLRKDGDVVVLDFTNAPIYALNQRAPLSLASANLLEYVRFFFTFVRGRHGRFQLCESIDDIHWRDDPAPSARRALGQLLAPLDVKSSDSSGWFLEARMIFKDTLFQTTVTVTPQGLVTLSDEKLLVEDMPVLDDTFGQ